MPYNFYPIYGIDMGAFEDHLIVHKSMFDVQKFHPFLRQFFDLDLIDSF